ncbi:MAG: Mediator of RNA polymerase II transcription subunit 7 [Lichina confinis]|nr:MAG: Mediator of RNA polymerase II transcription subunit 7 [Lichina confinis]
MAEPSNQPEGQQQANMLSAAFPAPPPFYKSFTADNLARLKQLQHSGTQQQQQQQQQQQRQGDGENDAGPSIEHKYDGVGDESSSEKSPATEDLPPELQYLIPPAPPTVGTYRSFGDSYSVVDILPALEEQGIEQLYPSGLDQAPVEGKGGSEVITDTAPEPGILGDGTQSEWTLDRAFYLQKMAKSLLLNFMELVGILSVDASQYGRKMEHLRTLFINAHHLVNEYRPHQARETLIMLMEEQLRRTRAETQGIYEAESRVETVLRDLGGQHVTADRDLLLLADKKKKHGGNQQDQDQDQDQDQRQQQQEQETETASHSSLEQQEQQRRKDYKEND